MSDKILGVTYQSISGQTDGFSIQLPVGTFLGFVSEMSKDSKYAVPKGILPITIHELKVSKYKKLASVLVVNKLLKPTATTFRLDKIFGIGLDPKVDKKEKVKKIKAKKTVKAKAKVKAKAVK